MTNLPGNSEGVLKAVDVELTRYALALKASLTPMQRAIVWDKIDRLLDIRLTVGKET